MLIYSHVLGLLTLAWPSVTLSSWTVPEIVFEEEDKAALPATSRLESEAPKLAASPKVTPFIPKLVFGTPRVESPRLELTTLTPATPWPLEEVAAVTDAVPISLQQDSGEDMEEESYFDSSMHHTITAYLGKMAVLTCIVHAAKSDKSVSWIRGRDLRILTVGRYTYTSDLRFEALHTEGSSEWTLRIRSVQLRDRGNYDCQITTKPIRIFTVVLNVVEPSVEVLGAPDLFVNRASMINLTCVIHHAPFPPEAITWYHDNKTISYTSPRGGVSVVEERGETTTSFLLLQNAQPVDSGAFTCQPEDMTPAVVTLHVLDGEHPAAMQSNTSVTHTQTLTKLVGAFLLSVLYKVL